jgi:hypothetical protein
VDHNRNEIAERFFKTDAEWLLQIDTDIEFPATIVESLLAVAARDKKVLAASVPLGPPYPSSAWMKTKTPGIWAGMPASEITAEGVKCDGIATAVCLIHREVFEAIADREGQRWFLKYEVGRLDRPASEAAWTAEAGPARDRQYVPMGEDLAFSIRAAEAGFQCWAVKVPGLRHHKVVPLSHDFDPEPEIVTSGFSQPQFVDVDLTQAEESALKEYAAKAFIDGSGETEPRGIMADFPPQGA